MMPHKILLQLIFYLHHIVKYKYQYFLLIFFNQINIRISKIQIINFFFLNAININKTKYLQESMLMNDQERESKKKYLQQFQFQSFSIKQNQSQQLYKNRFCQLQKKGNLQNIKRQLGKFSKRTWMSQQKFQQQEKQLPSFIIQSQNSKQESSGQRNQSIKNKKQQKKQSSLNQKKLIIPDKKYQNHQRQLKKQEPFSEKEIQHEGKIDDRGQLQKIFLSFSQMWSDQKILKNKQQIADVLSGLISKVKQDNKKKINHFRIQKKGKIYKRSSIKKANIASLLKKQDQEQIEQWKRQQQQTKKLQQNSQKKIKQESSIELLKGPQQKYESLNFNQLPSNEILQSKDILKKQQDSKKLKNQSASLQKKRDKSNFTFSYNSQEKSESQKILQKRTGPKITQFKQQQLLKSKVEDYSIFERQNIYKKQMKHMEKAKTQIQEYQQQQKRAQMIQEGIRFDTCVALYLHKNRVNRERTRYLNNLTLQRYQRIRNDFDKDIKEMRKS